LPALATIGLATLNAGDASAKSGNGATAFMTDTTATTATTTITTTTT